VGNERRKLLRVEESAFVEYIFVHYNLVKRNKGGSIRGKCAVVGVTLDLR
jgi:hypothetical protein